MSNTLVSENFQPLHKMRRGFGVISQGQAQQRTTAGSPRSAQQIIRKHRCPRSSRIFSYSVFFKVKREPEWYHGSPNQAYRINSCFNLFSEVVPQASIPSEVRKRRCPRSSRIFSYSVFFKVKREPEWYHGSPNQAYQINSCFNSLGFCFGVYRNFTDEPYFAFLNFRFLRELRRGIGVFSQGQAQQRITTESLRSTQFSKFSLWFLKFSRSWSRAKMLLCTQALQYRQVCAVAAL